VTHTELIDWVRTQRFAVVASTHPDGSVQAAVVGVAVTDELELVFDTLATSRKCENLRRDGRCAVVVWQGAVTLQLEGVADEPGGAERARLVARYLDAFPDGHARAALPDIVYIRIRPAWRRVSDFSTEPPRIEVL